MSFRYKGGVISATPPTTSTTSASGLWTLQQQLQAQAASQWPAPPVASTFQYVTMLLPGTGTNGAQNNTFIDGSSAGRTITRSGNTTQGTFSPFGSNWSNYFDGSGDWLTVTNTGNYATAFGTGDFTVEFWIYPTTSFGSFVNIYDARGTDDNAVMIRILSGNITYYSFGADHISATAPSINTWSHVALSRVSGSSRLYVNGVQVGSTYSDTLNYGNESVIAIGGRNNDGANAYQGYISNVRVVNGGGLYSGSTISVPTTPLTTSVPSGTVRLLTCQANRFMDSSASALAVAPNGGAGVQRFSPFAPTVAYSTATNGGGAYFDGSDKLTLANNAAFDCGTGNDMCWEAWVYVPSSNSGGDFHIWSAHTGGVPSGYYFTFNSSSGAQRSGLIVYSSGGSGGGMHSNINTPFNSWNHLCITRQSGRLRFFVNGQLTATTTSTYSLNTDGNLLGINGGNNFTGGVGFNGGGRYINGSVPTSYQTSSTTLNTQIFTPPTAPFTTTSQGATAGDVKVLTTFTNAGIIDNAMMGDFETVNNAQISTAQSKWGGGAMYFDGTSDYLEFPASPVYALGTGDFTFECWVYTSTTSGDNFYRRVYMTDGPTGNATGNFQVTMIPTTGGVNVWDGGGTLDIQGTVNVCNGAWHHIAVCRVSGTVTLYVDGVADGAASYTTSIAPNSGSPRPRVGSYNGTDGDFLGYMNDMRLTKGLARYTANFTPPTAAFPLF